jgi:hypothetical protein
MLLYASSDSAAQAVVRVLRAGDIEAAGATPRGGTYPVSVKVPQQREPEALDIAKTIDPTVRQE